MESYILLNCSPGSEKDVITEALSVKGVIEVNGVFGKYDVIVRVSCADPNSLESTVSQIRKIKVMSSHTLPVLYGQGGSIDRS